MRLQDEGNGYIQAKSKRAVANNFSMHLSAKEFSLAFSISIMAKKLQIISSLPHKLWHAVSPAAPPPSLPVSFAIWAAPVFAKFCCQLSKPRQPFVFRMQQQQQQQRREFDARGKKRWEKTLLENHCNNFICNAIFSL